MEKLKPCPFCGGEAELRMEDTGTIMQNGITCLTADFYIRCRRCRTRTPVYQTIVMILGDGSIARKGDGAADAAAMWNKRTTS